MTNGREFDVFISHKSHDAEIALTLKANLDAAGLRTWVYEGNRIPGPYRLEQKRVLEHQPVFVILASEPAAQDYEVQGEIWHELNDAYGLLLQIVPVYVASDFAKRDSRVKRILGLGDLNSVILEAGVVNKSASSDLVDMIRKALENADQSRAGGFYVGDKDIFGRHQKEAPAIADDIHKGNKTAYVLHGPPGVGKTSLALVVSALLRRCSYSVSTVNLDREDTTSEHIFNAMHSQLDGLDAASRTDPQEVAQALGIWAHGQGPFILYFDNFEQVEAGAREALFEIARSTPRLKLLITSRVEVKSKAISIECYRVDPLSTPTDKALRESSGAEIAETYEGIRLFLDRIGEFKSNRRPPEVEAAMVNDTTVVRRIAKLCRELNGFPGPIEAVARSFAKSGNIEELFLNVSQTRLLLRAEDELEDATMYVAVKSILDVHTSKLEERAFLYACGFRDGFSTEAAQHVFDPSKKRTSDNSTSILLSGLVESGLLIDGTPSVSRWRMYLPIQEAGERLLEEHAFGDEIRNRFLAAHSEYYCDLAAKAEQEARNDADSDQDRQLRQLALSDKQNLVLALENAIESKDDSSATLLLKVLDEPFRELGPATLYLELANRVIEALKAGTASSKVATTRLLASRTARTLGRYEEAWDHAEAACISAPESDQELCLDTLVNRSDAAAHSERPGKRMEAIEEIRQLLEASGSMVSPEGACRAYLELAGAANNTEGYQPAIEYIDLARPYARRIREKHPVPYWRYITREGIYHYHHGLATRSVGQHEKALQFARERTPKLYEGGSHTNLALSYSDLMQFEEAQEHVDLGREIFSGPDGNPGWLAVNRTAQLMIYLYCAGHEPSEERRLAARRALAFIDTRDHHGVTLDQAVERTHYGETITHFRQLHAEAVMWAGDEREAHALLRIAKEYGQKSADVLTRERWFRICMHLAELSLKFGKTAEAIEHLSDTRLFYTTRCSAGTWEVAGTRPLIAKYRQLCGELGVALD